MADGFDLGDVCGDVEMKFDRFTPADLDYGGILQTWKSDEMLAACMEAAEEVASSANGMVDVPRLKEAIRKPPYKAGGTVLQRTAIGMVKTATKIGKIDQVRNHTLDKFAG